MWQFVVLSSFIAIVGLGVWVYRLKARLRELATQVRELEKRRPSEDRGYAWALRDSSSRFESSPFEHTAVPGPAEPALPANVARKSGPPTIDRVIDNVFFTVTAPRSVEPSSNFDLILWVHLDKDTKEIIQRAKHALALDDVLVRSDGPFPIAAGAELSVSLRIDGMRAKLAHKPLRWVRSIGMATFTVTVPEDTKAGTYAGMASIRWKGARIATVNFVLNVAPVVTSEPPTALPADVRLHKNAFASYATEDRDEVIAHVQGMHKAVRGLKVFIDVVDLRAGELWEHELRKRIAETDVFYLFWCRHAKASEWVEKEWRCALENRGIEYIDPVPLEGADAAAPPPELAVKHFNDPLLPYKKGHHAR